MPNTQPWWQTAVIYQIYPRSFQDTNADGIGDLPGITARLPYLAAIGIDAIWISPFYPSPMADFGYDVADYTSVDPMFGNLGDFDALIAAAHEQGLKVILDFVPNHTSDQHPWFLQSRSSRTNPRRDWYLWHDAVPYSSLPPGEDKRPLHEQQPNNWKSHFGGSAWTWDEATQQFYCHSFLKQQPDLNWRNPAVRLEIYTAMKFWLDRGVDGFRMDVLWLLIKDDKYRNNPFNGEWKEGDPDISSVFPLYTADQPETHEIVREMRSLMDSYGPTSRRKRSTDDEEESSGKIAISAPVSHRVLIGEIYLPLPELVRYYGLSGSDATTPHLTGANLPFNFHLILAPWQANVIAGIIRDYEALLPQGAWPNYVLGNHDQSRLATRIGPAQARVAAMLLLTLRGTPTLYYGDELGMTDVAISTEQVQDPAERNEPNKGKGRDPERSPMLWDSTANAGFTSAEATPWLPLLPNYEELSVSAEGIQPRSMLSLYRVLLALRRQHPALHSGGISDVSAFNGVLTYIRSTPYERFQVYLNLTADEHEVITLPGQIAFTTLMDGAGSDVQGTLTLEGGEGVLIALS